jgi:hypothetical protein
MPHVHVHVHVADVDGPKDISVAQSSGLSAQTPRCPTGDRDKAHSIYEPLGLGTLQSGTRTRT